MFSSPGAYSFVVPAGVTSIAVTAVGAAGGACPLPGFVGGEGASVSAAVPVSAGQELFVDVGSAGAACAGSSTSGGAGGLGGGGTGGAAPGGVNGTGGGGGGGASAVATPAAPGFGSLVVAAGGGGAGGNLTPTVSDDGGAAGSSAAGTAGGGAGASGAGGAGGTGNQAGGSGSLGLGGNGGSGLGGGGGGAGGGYYGGGGGGGGTGGGGGGGSSFVVAGATGVSGPTVVGSAPEVAITYAAPMATESTTAIAFPGTQPPGVASAEEVFTLTNSGSAPLVVSGVLLGGADTGDFLIDNQCQQPVAAGSSCQIGVRFSPQTLGSRSATLTPLTNAPAAPAAVSLGGTGGSLPTTGTGSQGGTSGAAAKVELLTCKPPTKSKHRKAKTPALACTGKLFPGTVAFTPTRAATTVIISRGRTVYATGASVAVGGGATTLVVTELRTLKSGRYTLTTRTPRGRRTVAKTEQITIS